MNKFRQLNREYDDMLERRYQAEIEAAEDRQNFIDEKIEEYKAYSWSEQIELLSAYMDNYEFETADECDRIMSSIVEDPIISNALDAAMNIIAEAEYDELPDDDDY